MQSNESPLLIKELVRVYWSYSIQKNGLEKHRKKKTTTTIEKLGMTDKTAKTSLKNQHLPNGDNFMIIPSHLRSKM